MDMKGSIIKVGDVVDYHGKYCMVEALISSQLDTLVGYKVYSLRAPSLSMKVPIDDVTLVNALKYKVGDIVKLTQSGWGTGSEWVGYTAVIVKDRGYGNFDIHLYSSCGDKVQHKTSVRDYSFKLIQRPRAPLTGELFNPDEVELEIRIIGQWVDYYPHKPTLRVKHIKSSPSAAKLLEIQKLEDKIKELKSSL